MSSGAHIHMVDGKQMPFPNDNCPICGTAKPTAQKQPFIPKCYRKGNTVVTQISRFTMGTITWWKDGKCFLMSLKKVVRGIDKKIQMTPDGKFVWNYITIRLSTGLAKQLVAELSKLIQDTEGVEGVPTRG